MEQGKGLVHEAGLCLVLSFYHQELRGSLEGEAARDAQDPTALVGRELTDPLRDIVRYGVGRALQLVFSMRVALR